jgi:hypothetical protein
MFFLCWKVLLLALVSLLALSSRSVFAIGAVLLCADRFFEAFFIREMFVVG